MAELTDPSRWSIAKHYANGTRGQRREIRHALRKGKGADEASFARWVMEREPWRFFARPDQLEPPGPWTIWVLQAGRGAGKTRGGAEWAWDKAAAKPDQIVSVVSPTFDDLDKVTFGGPSGIAKIAERQPWMVEKVTKRPWLYKLTNGSIIQSFTGEALERLRGPNHHWVWWDEAAASARVATDIFDQIMFGLRLGDRPRLLITSTPKPIPLFRTLAKREREGDQAIVFTRATTIDNRANLADPFLDQMRETYAGTRLGKQELEGALLEDIPGALWQAAMFQEVSVPQQMDRVVVAVDPSGASSDKSLSDEIGIVAAGTYTVGDARRFVVLQDATIMGSPIQWATRATNTLEGWGGDRIVAESNFGGGMVESTIRQVDPDTPVKLVHASRGKVVRAEPVAALYEQGRVGHAGRFPELEEQMLNVTQSGYVGAGSPDRVDALVWAITDLMSGVRAPTVSAANTEAPSYWRTRSP